MIATTDAPRLRAKIVVLRPATRAATGRLLARVVRGLATGRAATVRPAESVIATEHVRPRAGTDAADQVLPRALLGATSVARVRASVLARAAQEAFPGATIAVRPGLSPRARGTAATHLRETASATMARAPAESGARASGGARTASVLGAATEASVLLEVAKAASVRPRAQVARRPVPEIVVRVLRRIRPIAVRSAKVATALRARPTSAPRTSAIAMAITIVGRARAPRSRGKLLRRATCRAFLRCSRARKSGES